MQLHWYQSAIQLACEFCPECAGSIIKNVGASWSWTGIMPVMQYEDFQGDTPLWMHFLVEHRKTHRLEFRQYCRQLPFTKR